MATRSAADGVSYRQCRDRKTVAESCRLTLAGCHHAPGLKIRLLKGKTAPAGFVVQEAAAASDEVFGRVQHHRSGTERAVRHWGSTLSENPMTPDYPKSPFPAQKQPMPGSTDAMQPRPDHGETRARAS
jgi:hypothetical protein